MKLFLQVSNFEHTFYNRINLHIKDVIKMFTQAHQQIKTLLQTAYQKNQITTINIHNITYTGTVDYVSPTTVYLGLAAGHSREIPLTQISRVQLHQFQSWWYLYDSPVR